MALHNIYNIYTISTQYLLNIYSIYLQVTRQLYLAAATDTEAGHSAPPVCHLVSDSYTQSCSGRGSGPPRTQCHNARGRPVL